MKYLSEEDEQHVAEDYQGPPAAPPVVACSDLLGAQNHQPEMWTVAKDVICAAIPAVEAGLEYTQELLAHHEVSLGRTTRKNKLTAEAMERDIEQMRRALDSLRKCL